MSVTFGFYNSLNGDRKYTAEQMSSLFDGIIEDGIYAHIYDTTLETPKPFKIIPGEGMNVVVKKGRAWLNHTWTYNDNDYTISMGDAPGSGQSRLDIIAIRVNTDSRENSIVRIQGTPTNSNPTKPGLTFGVGGVYEYELATITVEDSYTAIPSSAIDQSAIGTLTPYVTAPLQALSLSDYLASFRAEFDAWMLQQQATMDDFMANISGLLTEEQATYLLTLYDQLHNVIIKATYDAEVSGNIGKYVVCTNGVRTFSAVTTSSGSVTFTIGDRRADTEHSVPFDSSLGTWSVTMYESSSNLTPIGETASVVAYYYGSYPEVEIGGEPTPVNAYAFRLLANNTSYSFDDTTSSHSVSNVYYFNRNTNTNAWNITVLVPGSIIFDTLSRTKLDLCAVGGGGGGGGGYANASSYYDVVQNTGGRGGGGGYTEVRDYVAATNTSYDWTIGSGGTAGVGAVGSSNATKGGDGGTTNIQITSNSSSICRSQTTAGKGGNPGTKSNYGTAGAGNNTARYVFSDSSLATVCGAATSNRGGSGEKGTATAYWNDYGGYQNATNGGSGQPGLVCIRSAASYNT